MHSIDHAEKVKEFLKSVPEDRDWDDDPGFWSGDARRSITSYYLLCSSHQAAFVPLSARASRPALAADVAITTGSEADTASKGTHQN